VVIESASASFAEPLAQRVGIVVVHGVTPQQQYSIQDECAAQLCGALNADPYWSTAFDHPWVTAVLNPTVPGVATSLEPHATISRVRLDGDDAERPEHPYFDVVEAYWSPLDKGKTTFTQIVSWLLQTIFVPLNTTARYMSSRPKTAYDVALVTLGILGVVLALAGALLAAVFSLNRLITIAGHCPPTKPDCSGWEVAFDPSQLSSLFSWPTLLVLALGAVGAVLLAQALKGVLAMYAQRGDIAKQRPAQRRGRVALIACVTVAGALMLAAAALWPVNGTVAMGWPALGFIVAALCFMGGRTLAQSFIVNFFGDVEIYTTRDENVDFYAMREAILSLVTATTVDLCRHGLDAHGKPDPTIAPYDRVFLLAHSLGSTIGLDALMRFWNLCEQDAELVPAFKRLRAFVTFGSPLEKTKYFFDVLNPSPSLSLDQWRSDVYGALFTSNVRELDVPTPAKGIFWGNYWYFKDAVANQLDSYRSFISPGTRLADAHHKRHLLEEWFQQHYAASGKTMIGQSVCRNEQGSKGFVFPEIIPHGEYLLDPWFWHGSAGHLGVLDVVARLAGTGPMAVRGKNFAPAPSFLGTVPSAELPPAGTTGEFVSEAVAQKHAIRFPAPPGGDLPRSSA
jgi:hypothetical protein